VSILYRPSAERRDIPARECRDRLSTWLELHPSELGDLPRHTVEALSALLETAQYASAEGRALREVAGRLQEMAMRDPLTGLPNRRAVEEKLASEWERAHRYDRPLAVLMGDVDSLKAVNDAFGHHVGDEMLRQVATSLVALVRSGDIAGRIGGDEFVVICPETDEEAAAVVAHKLTRGLAEAAIKTQAGPRPLEVSIGWASAVGVADSAALLRRADGSLYRVKTSRRPGPPSKDS
jgi:diguanylate cyclase (GGDEF)-like protein